VAHDVTERVSQKKAARQRLRTGIIALGRSRTCASLTEVKSPALDLGILC
jgi:hypothetical protein